MSTTGNQSNLSAAKQALLAKLLGGKASGAGATPVAQRTIPKQAVRDVAPLSFGQQRIWSHELLELEAPLYNVITGLRLRGALDVAALEKSLQELVERHATLRTTFVLREEQPVQVIAENVAFSLSVEDFSSLSDAEAVALQSVRDEASRPFDLQKEALFRARLLKVEEQHHFLVMTLHHIVTDGWSTGVLLRELTALYTAFSSEQASPLPEAELQYLDYAHWQREQMTNGEWDEQLAYWKKQLADQPELLQLPTDHPRPAKMTHRGAGLTFALSAALTEQLKELARQANTTMFMTLMAAFKTLLYRYSGQSDISVGTPIAGRTKTEFEGMIGFFVNSLVLRSDLAGNPSFRQVLEQERNVALEAFAHQELPFDKLMEELQPPRDPSYTPLFQTLFALQTPPVTEMRMNGVTLEFLEHKNQAAKHDLSLYMYEDEGVLQGLFEYSTDLFDAATMKRLATHWRVLLEGIAANPDERVDLLPLLTATEWQQILEWNNTTTPYPADKCVHELFEEQVARTPDAIAAEYNGQMLTYAELNARANQIARTLQARGVGPEKIVGLFAERSLEMLTGLLGILKSGGAYVPLDPSYPAERLAYMVEDAHLAVLLTQEHLVAKLPAQSAEVLRLDADGSTFAKESTENVENSATPDNIAYIIYTSGSTGKPKGVMVLHRGVTNYLCHAAAEYEVSAGQGTLVHSPVGFDLTVTGLFPPLLVGAKVVLMPESSDVAALGEALRASENLSLVKLTPAHLQFLAQQIPAEELAGRTRMLIIGGEALLAEHIALWQEHAPQTVLVNEYGPTEATVGCCVYKVPQNSSVRGRVSIGRPIANTKMYLLNNALQPVPVGVTGEIYIGGDGVARGYLNRPDLTEEKFIPDPFSNQPGARFYRTGDAARYLPNGEIEYLGRFDEQVKIRGYRIELGEIDAVLGDHPAIRETLVLAREDEPGDKRLVAYLVTDPELGEEQKPTVEALRTHLLATLPEYMVPSAFVTLDAFPLTANGKVDRRALPEPDGVRPQLASGFTAPRTEVEEKLAAIWAAILQVEQVGIHDNFHTLGGHSLMAILILSRIRETFGVMLPFAVLFDNPTVAGLGAHIQAVIDEAEAKVVVEKAAEQTVGKAGEKSVAKEPTSTSVTTQAITTIPTVARDGELPISFAQQRLWFLDQLEPDSAAYNIPFAIRLTGALDLAVLQETLNEIVRRHEALRTTFVDRDGEAVQVIAPAKGISLPMTDLTAQPADKRETLALDLFRAEGLKPFRLSEGPLFRAELVRLQSTEHILILNMHHIVSDGWSLRVFNQELTTLYEAFVKGQPSPLPELPIQYADFAHWQRNYLTGDVLDEQLSYWKRQLGGDLPVLQLPTDFPRGEQKDTTGAHLSLSLPPALAQAIKRFSQGEGSTIFMTLTAAFKLLLSRHAGQEDILIGTPTANRNRSEIEGLIGFFLNTLVIRTDLSGSPSFRELVARVREAVLEASSHAELPFEKLVEEIQPERNLSRNPLFDVMVNPGVYDAKRQSRWTVASLTLEPVSLDNPDAIFPMELYIGEQEQEIHLHLLYQSALFSEARIQVLLDQFRYLLEQIAADPNRPLHTYSLVTDASRALLPDPAAVLPAPEHPFVAEQIREIAKKAPSSVAIAQGGKTWTYADLNDCSDDIAHHLLATGLQRGETVAIVGTRSFGLIAAMLGVLKSGGVLLTVDQNLPLQRQMMMIEQAATKQIVHVSDDKMDAELQTHFANLPVLSLDPQTGKARGTQPNADLQMNTDLQNEQSISHDANSANETYTSNSIQATLPTHEAINQLALPALQPEDAAYLFFTSGTTGVPKGVLGVHKGLNHFLHWQRTQFGITEQDRFAQLTSLSFDVVLRDIFLPLTSGATLCLPDTLDDLSGDTILPWLERDRITALHTVPSLAGSWLSQPPAGITLHTLRYVFSAGEPLTDALVRRWKTTFPQMGTLVNLYGPTETTLAKCFYIVPADPHPGIQPVGQPLPQTQALVLSEHGTLCGIGEAGEIVIRTPYRTRGYVNVPDEQATRFRLNPFGGDQGTEDDATDLLYHTGDRGRYRPDGLLEILGRTDDQVKIRGVRIQLSEIAAALVSHPAVESGTVLDFKHESGDYYLAAYAVPQPGADIRPQDIRRHLSHLLPAALVPASVTLLDRLPLTPNGKVDRRALPQPDLTADAQHYIAPRNETEQQICTIWQEVLGNEKIGVEDNFFMIGGHSLLATQVLSRLRKAFAVELPLRILFERPTVAEQAQAVTDQLAKQTSTAPLLTSITQEEQTLANLNELSDEEVAAMLAQLMEQEDDQ